MTTLLICRLWFFGSKQIYLKVNFCHFIHHGEMGIDFSCQKHVIQVELLEPKFVHFYDCLWPNLTVFMGNTQVYLILSTIYSQTLILYGCWVYWCTCISLKNRVKSRSVYNQGYHIMVAKFNLVSCCTFYQQSILVNTAQCTRVCNKAFLPSPTAFFCFTKRHCRGLE